MAVESTVGPMAKLMWANFSRANSMARECTQQRVVCLGEVCGTKASVNSGYLKFLLGRCFRGQFDLI